MDVDECENSAKIADCRNKCYNTDGSYTCLCDKSQFDHFPLADFDREALFLVGPGLDGSQATLNNTGFTKEPVNSESVRIKGGIIFTSLQAEYLRSMGAEIPESMVDDAATTARLAGKGYNKKNVKDAAAFTHLWKDNFDASAQTYTIPWFFHSSFPVDPPGRAAIREGFREMEEVTCLRFQEIQQNEISRWSHSIAIHYTPGHDGICRSYVGQVIRLSHYTV